MDDPGVEGDGCVIALWDVCIPGELALVEKSIALLCASCLQQIDYMHWLILILSQHNIERS